MDQSFHRKESDLQQEPSGFLVANLQTVSGVITWLAGLIQLTEEEQEDAGICYPGD